MPIAKTRLSDQVAQELQNMIADETYKVGQKLPVENELAQMFSVSRVTVREAVRKLSVMGILDVRQGGGTFVKCLTPESFMTPVLPMLALDKKNLNDIFEVRILIECKSAELAAQNITDAQLEKLKRLLDKMDACALQEDLDTYNQYDTKFHHLAQHRAFPTDAALSFDRSLDTTLPESDTALAVRYISDHLAEDLTADAVGSSIRMSGKQANELFKREYGCTVAQFINRFRLFRAKELLCYTNSSITEIATMTGFKTVHYFSRYFKEKENLSPIEYKRTVTETISLHTLSG